MKEEIKKIQDYFVNKMLSDDFEIIKMEELTCEIIIDNEYEFTIWMGNSKESRTPYHSDGYFIKLKFNQKQAYKMNTILKKRYSDFKNNELLKKKRAQFEKLKKELGES